MQWVEWPGKSPIVPGSMEHPAAFHMLDVAAVAERLIAPFPIAPPLRDALVVLAGLHDTGKISQRFCTHSCVFSARAGMNWLLPWDGKM